MKLSDWEVDSMDVSTRDQVDTITHVGWIGEVGVRAGAPDFASPALERGREAAGCRREYLPGVSVVVVSTSRMPKEAHDAYYVPPEARVAELAGCADTQVRRVLEDIRKEIYVVRRLSDEAGYTFFVLRRGGGRAGTAGGDGSIARPDAVRRAAGR